ncbi:MAG: molecular chaperone HtpG [Proteobacteria bacterium]|nr:molecular chaperone HtpG [Pseudomonadota bacterium]
MTAEKRSFQAEVSKLLHIVANSLYSEREVFLRELISNAADACDKLRYLALTEPDLVAGDPDYKVRLAIDAEAKTLTISDNGVGMNEAELDQNLGTIASSGTGAFVENLSGDDKKDVGLIGQFGVGFYAAFMVSEKVEVLTRRAGEDTGWIWTSDGLGEYTVASAEKAGRGTIITLHLKEDAAEFLEEARLRTIVKTYSDHIAIPIVLAAGEEEQALNEASALWTRQKSEITDAQYTEFYRHVSHGYDEPWLTTHWRAEGRFEYNALLFIPSSPPFDLYHPDRKHRVKLYVKRVFITDDCDGLVPEYLRFLKGVIDCEDLPLNVSRELLQQNPMLASISSAVTKRILSELTKKADKDVEAYTALWENFGAVLKEGLYGAPNEHKATLLDLVRFRSTTRDGLVSLKQYVEAMKDGQEHIYYITGESQDAIRNSPHLEGFAARGIEVLLLSDPIDDFWIPNLFEGYESKQFQSVTRGGADLDKVEVTEKAGDDKKDDADTDAEKTDLTPLVASIKLALGDKVKDVRESARLTDSACCLVADDGDLDMNLERLLRQHQQVKEAAPRVLEINPGHPLIKGLSARIKDGKTGSDIEDAAFLLLDQARIMDGESVTDPKAFAMRMSKVMEMGLVG